MHSADKRRFNLAEQEIYEEGNCCWQTGYGLPWNEYCEKSVAVMHFDNKSEIQNYYMLFCLEHSKEAKEAYGPWKTMN